MTLEGADIEKIQAIIDRVVNPLIAKVDTIYGGLMPRIEYESRHKHIEQSIEDNRQDIRDLRQYAREESKRLQEDNDNLWKEIAAMKQSISDQRITTIRYMVAVFVGIVIAIVIPILFKMYGG
jgi:ABC-type multidrug transport system fused ATPase/permease subunit